MNRIEVSCQTEAAADWEDRANQICRRVLDLLDIDDWELSVVLCGDSKIRTLNSQYRGIDEPTDVLAFPQDSSGILDGCRIIGDIVVSTDTMAVQAHENGTGTGEELSILLAHGILHLNGMDHNTSNSRMMRKQNTLLRQLKEDQTF